MYSNFVPKFQMYLNFEVTFLKSDLTTSRYDMSIIRVALSMDKVSGLGSMTAISSSSRLAKFVLSCITLLLNKRPKIYEPLCIYDK